MNKSRKRQKRTNGNEHENKKAVILPIINEAGIESLQLALEYFTIFH